jgi:hypothetical protein
VYYTESEVTTTMTATSGQGRRAWEKVGREEV